MDGLHLGWADRTNAAAPATWGQAMEVPDLIAKFEIFFPAGMSLLLSATGIVAARIPTPGAITSGYLWEHDDITSIIPHFSRSI